MRNFTKRVLAQCSFPIPEYCAYLVLDRRGYQVAVAEDATAGGEKFRKLSDQVELLILDLNMPNRNGGETLRHLRTLRSDLAVILSSGYNQVEATRKFVGKGLASFLQKPFTVTQLPAAVEKALDRRGKDVRATG